MVEFDKKRVFRLKFPTNLSECIVASTISSIGFRPRHAEWVRRVGESTFEPLADDAQRHLTEVVRKIIVIMEDHKRHTMKIDDVMCQTLLRAVRKFETSKTFFREKLIRPIGQTTSARLLNR